MPEVPVHELSVPILWGACGALALPPVGISTK